MKKTFIARLVGGFLVLGLMAAALSVNTASAETACTGSNCPAPTHGPLLGAPKPDLVVEIQNATCIAGNLAIKIRVQNTSNNPTASAFQTVVGVNNVVIPGSPVITNAPLFGGQVFHFNVPATGYQQLVTAYVDSGYQVAETNEMNNSTFKVAWCG